MALMMVLAGGENSDWWWYCANSVFVDVACTFAVKAMVSSVGDTVLSSVGGTEVVTSFVIGIIQKPVVVHL